MLLHVEEKIIDFTFFTAFNSDDNARVSRTKFLTRLNRQDSAKEGVAIIAGATSEHFAILNDWFTRVGLPTLAKWLFVHMTVHKHSLVLANGRGSWSSCNINDQEGTSTGLFKRLDSDSMDVLSLSELDEVVHLLKEVPVGLPLRVEEG